MKIYPSIDLFNNKCIRLQQGDFKRKIEYNKDPIDITQEYADCGAKYLHVVDLEGSKKQKIVHLNTIKEIIKASNLKVQVGGGIRSSEDIEKLINVGVNKVIIGSIAINQPDVTTNIIKTIGSEKIVIACDVLIEDDAYVLSHAWQKKTKQTLWQIIDYYSNWEIKNFLCTDIKKDGMLKGPNIQLYKKILNKYKNIKIQASGGVSTLEDIKQLKESKIDGVIIGKALLDGKLSLKEVIKQ